MNAEISPAANAPDAAVPDQRAPHSWRSSDRLMHVLGGGSRLEILRVLVESPKSVSAIAAATFLRMNMVSHELGFLKQSGLVCCSSKGTTRTYAATDRVRANKRAEMVQIAVHNDGDCWVVVHLDESCDDSGAIPPPDRFVILDGR